MSKGQRSETLIGHKPRTGVTSKSSFKPQPLPTAKKQKSAKSNMRATQEAVPVGQSSYIKNTGPGVGGMWL